MAIKADDFYGEPKKWARNQWHHYCIGALVVSLVSIAWLLVVGEFPYRIHVWALAVVGYGIVIELALQGWNGLDTCEDIAFVGYGAGTIMWAFKEVNIGSGDFGGNGYDLILPIVAFLVHFVFGIGRATCSVGPCVVSDDNVERAIRELRGLLTAKPGQGPHVFTADEVRALQRLLGLVQTEDQARNLRRAIKLVDAMTDRHIEALPQMLDGAIFGRRALTWIFWLLVGLGTVVTNWERIIASFRGSG